MGHKDLETVGKAAHDLFDDFTTYSARVASESAAGGRHAYDLAECTGSQDFPGELPRYDSQ